MDAPLTFAGLMACFYELLGSQDYAGAEELLLQYGSQWPEREAFLHLQFGELYIRWNLLTSALNHLAKAGEVAHSQGDELLVVQVREALRVARVRRAEQEP